MLNEKLREIDVKDSETKKDIMSLLVRYVNNTAYLWYVIYSSIFSARMNDTEEGYKMTDQDLIEQVVSRLFHGLSLEHNG